MTKFKEIISSTVWLSVGFAVLLASGCSTPASKLPSSPPSYVYAPAAARDPQQQGSLYSDTASLYEDSRARRVNDLVTIKIVENIKANTKEETTADKESSYNSALSNFFDVTSQAAGLVKGSATNPQLATSNKDKFSGKGEVKQEGSFLGSITARVMEVQPNGNLIIDSRKEITINYEKQILVLQGIIRPNDVDANNVVMSQKVADVRLYLVGDGLLQELQTPGWLGRLFGQARPF
ncbi:MAG: flagellar basal body L-ring protein FlgH [Nitrospirae bacterium]|uniref:flagellar basal body L-ring protein FlgH n=1 Tax=Candidatus Magnetobacterium casense TaxID=1455061 RepID=UPI000697042B|nr:flagellar basal body L-ring protein FlgH [Candidatus Magnetobacterium casensis]MBF0339169.1 flagellar basal body L-ring protein FlgH [Nitrospirota bacterium]